MKIHFLQWLPLCRLQGDDLPVDSKASVLRVTRKLIHSVSIHVHDDLISKLFPSEPAVTQKYVAALEGAAFGCVRTVGVDTAACQDRDSEDPNDSNFHLETTTVTFAYCGMTGKISRDG